MSFGLPGGGVMNDQMSRSIERLQQKETARVFNLMAERCFEICANNFSTRKLDDNEINCANKCFFKFMNHQQRVSATFQEQGLLNAPEGGEQQQ
eukprot:TRINITY_DN1140_c0_g1_i1.p1 TRINITY_DN1140_c0_g1~~TRINITY_DN1140_c0_g1_i1.p1  ORF type:complete len:94 (-),score=23.46 TRINITY_DN1140_c0_g1_i1:59-340(-)